MQAWQLLKPLSWGPGWTLYGFTTNNNKKRQPGILLCHCWQHSHHSPPGKVPWMNSTDLNNQNSTTGRDVLSPAGNSSTNTANHTHRGRMPLTAPAPVPKAPCTEEPQNPEHHCWHPHYNSWWIFPDWGAAINTLYRVIVNSSSDQKALYRRALCYNAMITSYGNI